MQSRAVEEPMESGDANYLGFFFFFFQIPPFHAAPPLRHTPSALTRAAARREPRPRWKAGEGEQPSCNCSFPSSCFWSINHIFIYIIIWSTRRFTKCLPEGHFLFGHFGFLFLSHHPRQEARFYSSCFRHPD